MDRCRALDLCYDPDSEEPKTPEITVIEPDSPPPPLDLQPTVKPLALPPTRPHRPVLPQSAPVLALPPIPRKPIPPSQPIPAPKKTLPVLPDAASIFIPRCANSKLKKSKPSLRARVTKNPRSSQFHCRHCDITCTGRVQWFQHLHSRKHQSWVNKDRFDCEICKVKATTKKDFERHTLGRAHREAARGTK